MPWIKALLSQMMGSAAELLVAGNLRWVVIDGSTVQGPGASETWYRLHIAIDLVKGQLIHVEVTDKHQGEHLDHYPLQERRCGTDRPWLQSTGDVSAPR